MPSICWLNHPTILMIGSISLLIILPTINTQYFKTCNDFSCQGEEYHCNDDDNDCTLFCDGDQYCQGVVFYCDGTVHECKVICNGVETCDYLDVFSNGSTTILCNVNSACSTTTDIYVYGRDNPTTVNVTCKGNSACLYMDVYLYGTNAANQANVRCQAAPTTSSCEGLDLHCETTNQQCEYLCDTTDGSSCKNTLNELYCKQNPAGDTCKIINYPAVSSYVQYAYIPTPYPSNAPTITPSIAPSSPPSITPTESPFSAPSSTPSTPPTIAPTDSPTGRPTRYQTTNDIRSNYIISTTKSPTDAPEEIFESTESFQTDSETTEVFIISGYIVAAIVIVIPIVFILAACIFHRKKKGSDRPGYKSLFKFFSAVGDFYTDLLFAFNLYLLDHYLFPYAMIFSFGPHALSIIIGLFYLTKWRQTKSKLFISEYATRFDKVVIISTLFAGFYASVELITSHLFHLSVLSFQISKLQKTHILNLKIINNVVLENIPCLYIQYLYLTEITETNIFDNGINITLLAMAFSITAIVFGLLTVSIRLFNGCIELIRGRIKDKSFNKIFIEFTLKSNKSGIIKRHHIHSHSKLALAIHLALHIQISQIEIVYTQKITDGIKIKAKLSYLDRNNKEIIKKELNDINSELYTNFHKECTKHLQVSPTDVEFDIIKLIQKN